MLTTLDIIRTHLDYDIARLDVLIEEAVKEEQPAQVLGELVFSQMDVKKALAKVEETIKLVEEERSVQHPQV